MHVSACFWTLFGSDTALLPKGGSACLSQSSALTVAASPWAFVNDGDWEERSLRVLRLVMDGLRYKPAEGI
jgi:hypothetical protein